MLIINNFVLFTYTLLFMYKSTLNSEMKNFDSVKPLFNRTNQNVYNKFFLIII